MSDRERDILTPEEERVRKALRGLSVPAASAAFRDRLKSQFSAGAVPAPSGRVSSIPWYRSMKGPALAFAAVAAALLVAAGLGNRGPGWRLQDPPSGGMLMVGGVEMAMDDPELNASLKPGVEVGMEDTMAVMLMVPERLYVELTPSSSFKLPKSPGRWFGRTVEASAMDGEIRISTGGAFEGGKLMVETPDVMVEVFGTTLAVITEDFGTCVCVFEGTVMMGPAGGDMEIVEAGMRRTVFNDGREPFVEDILPMERMKLEMLRDSTRPALEP